MPSRLRRFGRVVVGFALALLVVGGLLQTVGVRGVVSTLAGADPVPVALGGVVSVVAVLCWSEALRRVLSFTVPASEDGVGPVTGVRFRAAYLAGDFTKQVMPMGHVSGPAILSYWVSDAFDLEYERTLAAVTVSDLLNLLASLAIAAVGVCAVAVAGGRGLDVFVASLAVAGGGVAGLLALVTVYRPTLTRAVRRLATAGHALARRTTGHAPRRLNPDAVEAGLRDYYATLDVVGEARNRRAVGVAGGVALLGWCCYAAPLYAAALALDASVSLPLALLLVPLAGLATWVPLPGGLGGVEVALTSGLVAIGGLPVDLAAAVALLYRLCSYWFVVAVDGVAAATLLGR
ncbi:lysylphosphatidylglycerol synthase transmembrane domain-containing protein [Halobium salinum]|uniref:Lysylphosphatidylglycerol synthase transmembrane domain-containing protein n=1 Tax=Halobium salinum TaxID=1364940 RepID=A0ABD5PD86_9EURY|nr:lysylphosphatidylglycerol synthase transmembrane domain-containing protein [Halobium salinum]